MVLFFFIFLMKTRSCKEGSEKFIVKMGGKKEKSRKNVLQYAEGQGVVGKIKRSGFHSARLRAVKERSEGLVTKAELDFSPSRSFATMGNGGLTLSAFSSEGNRQILGLYWHMTQVGIRCSEEVFIRRGSCVRFYSASFRILTFITGQRLVKIIEAEFEESSWLFHFNYRFICLDLK